MALIMEYLLQVPVLLLALEIKLLLALILLWLPNVSTLCNNNMSGSVAVSINPLPTAFSVNGGGAYCSGGTGVPVSLNGSQIGVNYQVVVNGSDNGLPIAGSGSAIKLWK